MRRAAWAGLGAGAASLGAIGAGLPWATAKSGVHSSSNPLYTGDEHLATRTREHLAKLAHLMDRCKTERLPDRSALVGRLREAEARRDTADGEFDLLVVGGGATGAGMALDAASRGLKVALVERDDFASGTSSRSTKLIHGGVRYLEKAFLQLDYGQYKLVREALHERAGFFRVAPHLASALPIMTPCYSWFQLPYIWAGLKVYDLIAGSQGLYSSYLLSAGRSLMRFPQLKREGLTGSVVYFDGQMDDARMNVGLAMTAVREGAIVLNHMECTQLLHAEGMDGKVCGAVVRDTLDPSAKPIDIRARVVVNATGPFSDTMRQLEANPGVTVDDLAARKVLESPVDDIIQPSAGVHVILPDFYSPDFMGLVIPKTKDGRVLFMLPWMKYTLAGTTDRATKVDSMPAPGDEDIGFILDGVNDYLDIPLSRGEVSAAWSGIRPLALDPNAGSTENASRDHIVAKGPRGMITIAGGKWTTYRKMAEDAVDAAVEAISETRKERGEEDGANPIGPCVTEELQLIGAKDYTDSLYTLISKNFVKVRRWSVHSNKLVEGRINTDVAKHLASSYGDRGVCVAMKAKDHGIRLSPYHPVMEADVLYACDQEMASTAVDFLARRSRLAFLDTGAAEEALPRVVKLMGDALGWDRTRRQHEIDGAKAFLATMNGVVPKDRSK